MSFDNNSEKLSHSEELINSEKLNHVSESVLQESARLQTEGELLSLKLQCLRQQCKDQVRHARSLTRSKWSED